MERGSGKAAIAIAGAVLFSGFAPSFLDWQQSPDKRTSIVVYYSIAIGLAIYAFNTRRG